MAYVDNHLQRISSHDQAHETESVVCEPTIVPTVFVTGGAFAVTSTDVRWIGWEELPNLGGEMVEKRIVARVVMSNDTARQLSATLREMLAQGGH